MRKLEEVYYHVRQPKEVKNFWKLNQELSYIDPFAAFSKKKDSAKIMMAIYMIYDPKSQLINSGLSVEEVKKDISTNFLKDLKFDWSKYRDITVAYQNLCRTKIEKELDSYYLMIQERRKVADDLDWADDFQKKEEIVSTHDKYVEKYTQLVEALKQERAEKLMHGDYTPSLLEIWTLDKDE